MVDFADIPVYTLTYRSKQHHKPTGGKMEMFEIETALFVFGLILLLVCIVVENW
jgi:hypothetical protein